MAAGEGHGNYDDAVDGPNTQVDESSEEPEEE